MGLGIEKQGETSPLLEIKYRKWIQVYRSLQLKIFQNQWLEFKIFLHRQRCIWLSVIFWANILKLSILLVWKDRDLCSNNKNLSLLSSFTLTTITIVQDLLLLGRYLSRLSSTMPSSLHWRVHLLTESFTKLILMSHGGRGFTGNQDKQKKSMI